MVYFFLITHLCLTSVLIQTKTITSNTKGADPFTELSVPHVVLQEAIGFQFFMIDHLKHKRYQSQQLTCLLLLCFRLRLQIHNSFIKHVSVSCHSPLNLGPVQPGNLNKWSKLPSIEHRGGLKSHVFTPIFLFSAPLSQSAHSGRTNE